MIIVYIFLICFIGICLTTAMTTENGVRFISILVCMFFAVILALVTKSDLSKTDPKAIDVYRGKTTLEITYRDSIPIDSIVVFK